MRVAWLGFTVLLVFCSFATCEVTVMVAPDESSIQNPDACSPYCGNIECPCIGFASALNTSYSYYNNGSSAIVIEALPGVYGGPDNSQLSITFDLSIV